MASVATIPPPLVPSQPEGKGGKETRVLNIKICFAAVDLGDLSAGPGSHRKALIWIELIRRPILEDHRG